MSRSIARLARRTVGCGLGLTMKPLGAALGRILDHDSLPSVPELSRGAMVDLGERGATYVVDIAGPIPDAPVVLLMHAVATTGELTWFAVADELAASYRVVTFDQRWHGRGIASERFSLEDCADDAAAVMRHLGIERAIVVGYSMGGATAQLLWQRHPEMVAGVVLCATAARWRHSGLTRTFYSVLDLLNLVTTRSAAERVRSHVSAPTEAAQHIAAWGLRELRSTSLRTLPVALSALGRFDSTSWLVHVDVPAAVVVMTRDLLIPARRQRELASLIGHAWIEECRGGHAAVVTHRTAWHAALRSAIAHVALDRGDRTAGRPAVEVGGARR